MILFLIVMSASKFIQQQKGIYKNLKPVRCIALNETVHFNSTGLNHILYNRRRPRSHNEQHYRAGLIPHISEVIEKATHATEVTKSTDPLVVTWSIQHTVKDTKGDKQTVKVILVKEGAGKVYFLSVMAKRNNADEHKKARKNLEG
jgi:hypothetical protein